MSGTLSMGETGGQPGHLVPALFAALDCDRPLVGSSRHLLEGIDEVRLGRGAARAVQRSGALLELRFADKRMSSAHAVLRRIADAWWIEDQGSKNGIAVNGAPVQRHELASGDLVELGHNFFLYQAAVPWAPGVALDLTQDGRTGEPGLATVSPELAARFERLGRVCASAVPVLILGETGTGKELAARAVHTLSGRPGPFVAVNSAALAPNLVEAELFGVRKGAFSGAEEDRPGLVRTASGGTLFLDEIGDMPLGTQATLLRVLQEHEVTPVGATRPVKVDLRVVAATQHDLTEQAVKGRFRPDLLARISGFLLELQPLRERREDLGLLVATLLLRVAPGRAAEITFTLSAGRALARHAWPLNVRELASALSAAAALAGTGPIELRHLPVGIRDPAQAAPVERAPEATPARLSCEDEALRERVSALLASHGGNISAVARELGKTRLQIRRWIKRLQIPHEPGE